jgi:hypothetical protein
MHRHQTHLALKLLFDLGHDLRARAHARRDFGGRIFRRRHPDRTSRQNGVPLSQASKLCAHFCAQLFDFVVIERLFEGVGAMCMNDAERERPHRGRDD